MTAESRRFMMKLNRTPGNLHAHSVRNLTHLPTHYHHHARLHQPVAQVRAQQQAVQPEAGLAGPALAPVVPDDVEPLDRLEVAERVVPAAAKLAPAGGANHRLDEDVLVQ